MVKPLLFELRRGSGTSVQSCECGRRVRCPGEVALLADNNAALAGLVTASIVVPLAILAVVIWFFRKSAKRFDAEQKRSPRSEAPWRG